MLEKLRKCANVEEIVECIKNIKENQKDIIPHME